MTYCFICLFRADKSTSGLALRIPLLWKELLKQNEDVILVINQSLYNKTLSHYSDIKVANLYIIPEPVDFKVAMITAVPSILIYLLLVKKLRRFHLSLGGAFFIDYLRLLEKVFYKDIVIHTSIGSKNLEMIVDSNLESRYYKLHQNLMLKADKIDCLYSPKGFPDYSHKCVQSPGSFSWKYSTDFIKKIDSNLPKKNNIVFSGSLLPQKNYMLAIEAYKKLSQTFKTNYNNPNLIIIAPHVPPDLIQDIDLFNKFSLGKIIFEKYEHLDTILNENLIFLSLQDYDNYPSQALIEAMAFGCTIIATNSGETNKIVKEEYGNLLIECNIDSLVAAYIKTLKRPKKFNVLNNKFILQNHTIEVYVNYFKDEFLT